jgi:hypothetical protein
MVATLVIANPRWGLFAPIGGSNCQILVANATVGLVIHNGFDEMGTTNLTPIVLSGQSPHHRGRWSHTRGSSVQRRRPDEEALWEPSVEGAEEAIKGWLMGHVARSWTEVVREGERMWVVGGVETGAC